MSKSFFFANNSVQHFHRQSQRKLNVPHFFKILEIFLSMIMAVEMTISKIGAGQRSHGSNRNEIRYNSLK